MSVMKQLLSQFLRFAAVGLLAFAFDYAIFLLLNETFGVYYLVASTISYTCGTIVSFVLNMRFVYAGREGQTRRLQFVLFVILSLIGLGVNQLFLWLFVLIHIPSWLAKLMAAALTSLYNFFSRKYFFEDKGSRFISGKKPEDN